jgi:hypothetical protein
MRILADVRTAKAGLWRLLWRRRWTASMKGTVAVFDGGGGGDDDDDDDDDDAVRQMHAKHAVLFVNIFAKVRRRHRSEEF